MNRPDELDRHSLEVLDFPRVCALLAEQARSPQGADLCRELRPARCLEEARAALDEVQALADLEGTLGLPQTGGLRRVERELERARTPGTCWDVEAFLALRETLDVCHGLLAYLEDAAAEGSPLGSYALRMRPLYPLSDRLARTFGPRGELLDGASPALRELRSQARRVRERVLQGLEAVLRDAALEPAVQDEFVTLRGDRYVIPLRTDFRGYLKGIVHDRSRTGATFFVEPLEVVELNNRLSSLREEEEAEVRRILVELTGWVGRDAPEIRSNIAVAAHLDALAARLGFARRLRAERPRLAEEPVLELRAARHPLLELQQQGEVVPVDLAVGGAVRFLLVSGANAGGKTVALKTAGLLVAMARAGLFIPAAADSVVGWFSCLFADIGDEQDIDRHLSTFSGHVARLRDVLGRAAPGGLVLLDELGTGTDPSEGVGLSVAVVESLLEQGLAVLGTTHLPALKAFAHARADCQNAAVAFDPETGQPRYRLLYGHAGASNALDVAERLGMPARVMDRARAYATGAGGSGAELLRELERAMQRAEQAALEAETLQEQWRARVAEQERLLAEARSERDRARTQAAAQAQAAVREARTAFRRQVREFAQQRATQQETEAALGRSETRLAEALRPEQPAAAAPPEVAAGAAVHVRSLGCDGVVEGVEEAGARAAVRVGTLRVVVPREDLAAPVAAAGPRPPQRGGVRVVAEGAGADLVLVGCTVEEALARLDKALDRALVAGAEGFRVIHGRGSGALRRAVREHLEGLRQVAGTRSEQGDAATWVQMD